MSYNREGVDTLSEVSAFLGGILFTALLILIQQGESFNTIIFEANLTQAFVFTITLKDVIAFPLAITIILFVFSAFFFAIACSEKSEKGCDKLADIATSPFTAGLLTFYVSLFVILLLVNVVIAIVGIILAIWLTVWWSRAIKEKEKEVYN
jgi:hypothetical protein